ncbi:hypothetical protein PAAG_04263 [Paracoccidioides lutzii Pb01]|uniref:Uncharacterized protein n=1 Tax=Paracoccidioides lutzii (strain ATCC MYA-826 / Pb01) TaxID=502779 RepID=C1H0G9_PARBA|nr:hypothetical protein PAAG_04263 [Paracoccidioides lutzii Pb01]EEH33210.2 hypothetical protein PAAG_04263 [Paracoccidioides lutzii Pb01]
MTEAGAEGFAEPDPELLNHKSWRLILMLAHFITTMSMCERRISSTKRLQISQKDTRGWTVSWRPQVFNKIRPAIDYTAEEITRIMDVNYTGTFMAAQAVAKQMLAYKNHGSIILIASMSGLIANRGLISPAYNASKAALI